MKEPKRTFFVRAKAMFTYQTTDTRDSKLEFGGFRCCKSETDKKYGCFTDEACIANVCGGAREGGTTTPSTPLATDQLTEMIRLLNNRVQILETGIQMVDGWETKFRTGDGTVTNIPLADSLRAFAFNLRGVQEEYSRLVIPEVEKLRDQVASGTVATPTDAVKTAVQQQITAIDAAIATAERIKDSITANVATVTDMDVIIQQLSQQKETLNTLLNPL